MLTATPEGFVFEFRAMGSPCEIRIDTTDRDLALALSEMGRAEALRIEHKYSRYRPDSVLSRINAAEGAPIEVDDETAALLDYAAECHRLSGGRFDITSGVLRKIWRFDGSGQAPTAAQVAALLPRIGWGKVAWRRPVIVLPAGMEIDFGGLGKEYAVDTTLLKLQVMTDAPLLVNFGGDLRVSGPRAAGRRWCVEIESVDAEAGAPALLEIAIGALTTSGDARRFLVKDGIRYSHILDPRTGWPVKGAPRSVTVAAPTCLQAGILSTLAMLRGRGAEAFLRREGIQAWWSR